MTTRKCNLLYYIDYFMGIWLTPPGLNILIILIGLLLLNTWPVTGKVIVLVGLISLWLLSTPLVALYLVNHLQYQYPALRPDQLVPEKNAAIVVLEASLN